MKWRKRGRIFAPDGSLSWARHHAFPPTPLQLDDDVLRIYVAFCDERMVGRVGYVDVLLERPSEVVRVSDAPVLDIGAPGSFDDNGVVPTCVVLVGDELRLYYTGFRLGTPDAPYSQLLGLAISRDGGESFVRYSTEPVLQPSDAEAVTRASAHVSATGDGFTMYYSAGSGWTEREGKSLPVYNVRRLESSDGIEWGPEGHVCLDLANDDEHAIARPWPISPADGMMRMLYSYRARSHDYRIGLAVSADGESWGRQDDGAGISPSETGWDSEAVAYGAWVEHGGSAHLLYCGNGRGRSGFGYAELEAP
jgi:predicted GH43/DUF377 family glycosyl hydrolase